MDSAMAVCKRTGCDQIFSSQVHTRGRPRKFCSSLCRIKEHRIQYSSKKQIRPLGPCKKCGEQIIDRCAQRKYCKPCAKINPSAPRITRQACCTTCGSDFVAAGKAGLLPTRCNFCDGRKRGWVLRHCSWCGDLFGATGRHRRYCSPSCLDKWKASGGSYTSSRHRQETKTCVGCRSQFTTSMSTKTYCSKPCLVKNRPWKPEGMKAKGTRSTYALRRRAAQRAGDRDLTTYAIWKAEGGRCRLCDKQTIDPTTPRRLKPVKRDA